MRYEKSCGGIVYKIENNQIFYLIIQQFRGSHYSFPKGHMEAMETEEETAIREIKEETNIDVELHPNVFEKVKYMVDEYTQKTVVYFLAKAKSTELTAQESEISQVFWLSKEEAIQIITYPNDLEVFQLLSQALEDSIKDGTN